MSNQKIKELQAEIERLKQEAEDAAETLRLEALAAWTPTVENVSEIISDNRPDELEENWRDNSYEFPNGWIGKNVIRHGGREGCGEEYWIIFSVSKGDVTKYFQVDGWYQSYDGGTLEWADVYEVEAREVTVTQYFKV